MGLLDEVLGGVLGGRGAGGGQGMQGGGLGGMLGGAGGGSSPLMMALMALLGSGALGSGGLGGLLGGLTGGGGTGMQGGGGLGGLLNRFQQNGHGDVMQSWLGHGENRPIAPHQLDEALGSDTVESLSRQTGLSRDDLLRQLSQVLPQTVDRMTPQGRLPTEDEVSRW